MRLQGEGDLEGVFQAWEDVEPPRHLDAAVRRQAHTLLTERRAAREVQAEADYPAWLLALTAVTLLAALIVMHALPAGQVLWGQARRTAASLPLAPAWLTLLVSNLVAVLLAPVVAWRRMHGD